jgi:Arc/MetJ-type ribon-helix-helix transcriptional regulator
MVQVNLTSKKFLVEAIDRLVDLGLDKTRSEMMRTALDEFFVSLVPLLQEIKTLFAPGNNSCNKSISVNSNQRVLMDQLVEEGVFQSRSEIMRLAIIQRLHEEIAVLRVNQRIEPAHNEIMYKNENGYVWELRHINDRDVWVAIEKI